jgi:hypothetical protein
MIHPRLTESAPYRLDRFDRCQLCGRVTTDICTLRMWYECDDQDAPDYTRVLITCRGEEDYDEGRDCRATLEQHPRGYQLVPWLGGHPGHFFKLCGPCTFRNGAECRHPDLKQNGGEGLDFKCNRHPFAGTRVSYHNPDDAAEIGDSLVCETPFETLLFSECAGRNVKE